MKTKNDSEESDFDFSDYEAIEKTLLGDQDEDSGGLNSRPKRNTATRKKLVISDEESDKMSSENEKEDEEFML